jgi:hypothetical protein
MAVLKDEQKTPYKMWGEWLKNRGFAGLRQQEDCYCPIGELGECPHDAFNFTMCIPYKKGEKGKDWIKHGQQSNG